MYVINADRGLAYVRHDTAQSSLLTGEISSFFFKARKMQKNRGKIN